MTANRHRKAEKGLLGSKQGGLLNIWDLTKIRDLPPGWPWGGAVILAAF